MSSQSPGREKVEVFIGPAVVNPAAPAAEDGYEKLQLAIVHPAPAGPPNPNAGRKKKAGILKKIGMALALGVEQARSAGSSLPLPTPTPIERNDRAEKWDARYMGPELEVEKTAGGVDYVVVKGEMIALKATGGEAVSFDNEQDGEEVVLTEYGPRALDRGFDFKNAPPAVFEIVWTDPDTGAIRKYVDLPRNHFQNGSTASFIRNGQKVVVPLMKRRWQKD